MKEKQTKKLLLALVVSNTFVLPVKAADSSAVEFKGWNVSANPMTDAGGGIWQLSLTDLGRTQDYRVTTGDRSQNWPGSGNITLTYDANTHPVAWQGEGERIGTGADPGTWAAVGDDFSSKSASTRWFESTDPNQTVDFLADAFKSTVKPDVIPVPEPTTLALLAAALAGWFCLRRRS